MTDVAEDSAPLWCYIDDAGKIQGPFEQSLMRAWYVAGYFKKTTRVRRVGKSTVISELPLDSFKEIGDELMPFTELAESEIEGSEAGQEAEEKEEMETAAERQQQEQGDEALPFNPAEKHWYYLDLQGAVRGHSNRTDD